jgi:hypothetical protein
MNNPLANFDLSLFLENLPNTLQRPMTVAVGASILTHGLVLVGLPLLTAATDAPEKPDRVVNVITLTPEEQALLPQSAPVVTQMPLSLGTNGILPPLTGLMPTPAPLMPSSDPSKNPLLDIGQPFNNPFPQPNLFTDPPLIQSPDPIIIYRDRPEVKDEKKPDEKKPDEKKLDEKKPDEKKPDEKKPDEAASPESPTMPKLTPGVTGTTGPIAATTPNGAAALSNTQPATLPLTPDQLAAIKEAREKNAAIAKQQEDLRIATTFTPEMTTAEARQAESFNLLRQLGGKLVNSGITDEQLKVLWDNPIAMTETALPITPTPYDFSQAKVTIVTVVLDPNNQLLLPPKAIGSGYKYLDELAEGAVRKLLEEQRKTAKPSGKYQAIKFPIKFVIPPAIPPVS